ncbi:alpha/beta fold hydrolase [Bacillus massilinigeriensis]|uniref:alpha/beta fold hydrolase n=1 Tax=Bacillus massilionigeriensis TaxID=1805475 RepID=UPI00096B2CCA|nr:alpha/beta hydrolase [Bacillus massilionigeriensis]
MKLFSGKSDFTISKTGLSSVETIAINGVDQKILIQTEDIQNPILFMIHGGPSMPIPGVSNRGVDYALITCTKELVKRFTLVFWDQRGTGKSYSKKIPRESMRLQQFIQDAREVTNYLLKKFSQTKLHLMAHSWGTVIALSLAHQYPEKYYSYTAFSQITNWAENDKLCYKWLMNKLNEANDQKGIRELNAVGEPPYLNGMDEWSIIRKYLMKYKSMFYDTGDRRSPTFASAAKIMLGSPDYSLMDVFHTFTSGYKLSYTDQMLQDINTFDYFTEIPELEVPVLFIHGEKEAHVWPELALRYYEQLDAPFKKFFWSKKSSHAFHIDDAKENEQTLLDYLPKLAAGLFD